MVILLAIGIVFMSYDSDDSENGFENNKNYCSDESRNVDVCIEVYNPVCGYNSDGEKIKTYSNDCFACQDSSVEYWVEGEC